jgi:hypothetical protein
VSDDPLIEDFAVDEDLPPVLEARLATGGARLDKALSDLFPSLSRARVQALLADGVEASPDKWSLTEIAEAVRPVLIEHLTESDAALAKLVDERRGQRRATSDLSDIARAAAISAVDTLIVDRDYAERGTIGDDGALDLDPTGPVLAEELARLVVALGGRVLALPADRLPGGAPITAVLRYAQ